MQGLCYRKGFSGSRPLIKVGVESLAILSKPIGFLVMGVTSFGSRLCRSL